MNELIKINCETADRPTVMGRELHEALGIKSNYTTWFNRMCEYGFTENSDYVTCFPNLESENQHGGQNKADHAITIDMAREICMIQRSEIGRKYRQYFLEVEKQWQSPEAIMKRALTIADERIKLLEQERMNAPISADQLYFLRGETKVKAIDLCGCGRVYVEIGEKVEFKIEEFITDTLNVRSLRDVPNGRLEEALSLSKKFKPDEKLRGAIAEAREKLKQKGA